MKLDITAEKMMFDQIRYLAEFDILTGLPNRAQFQTALQRLPLRCISGSTAALLLIDLDGFKGINDTFGHQAGDECLKETAERLLAACKGADLVARIGGDEFAVLVSGCDSAESVAKLAGDRRPLPQPLGRTGRLQNACRRVRGRRFLRCINELRHLCLCRLCTLQGQD